MESRMNLFKSMEKVSLPRWDDLPEFGIYRDQLITIVNSATENIFQSADDNKLTVSMVNNYVKWKAIPKPEKKKYFKVHIAFCIVISALKPILTIANINKGIQLQIELEGEEKAYNRFCDMVESVFNKDIETLSDFGDNEEFKITSSNLGIYTSCQALYYKKIANSILSSLELEGTETSDNEDEK